MKVKEVERQVIKRDGRKVSYDVERIITAIIKAFKETRKDFIENRSQYEKDIKHIVFYVEEDLKGKNIYTVEEIQDVVERTLMKSKYKDVAKAYIVYRNNRTLARGSITDKDVMELLGNKSEYWTSENSNKDSKVVTVQRDYLAGITSTDIARRFLLPPEVCKAHDEGIIHQHDMDYMAQKALHNCCLCNLEDMLNFGTVINGVAIDAQKRLSTAVTVATQIITAVSSSQYGGITITLTHLAPFVRKSYEIYYDKYKKRGFNEEETIKWAKEDLKKEIKDSVQTFNYQINSMSTTNGQSPFLTVYMYINEDKEYEKETALLIEEFLKQRIKGMKNEKGVYITPAFPKLIYVLDENNIEENSPYWNLTVLAAKCTAKRMVPDYISAKKMREYKIDKKGNGNVYPCMGCVDGEEVICYKFNNQIFCESFKRMWNRLSDYYEVKTQQNGKDLYIDTNNVEIYDTKKGFVKNYRIIKNNTKDWLRFTFSNGRTLTCTLNHPFETENRGMVYAKDLTNKDIIKIGKTPININNNINFDTDKAWLLGLMLCDGCYDKHITVTMNCEGEKDVIEKCKNVFENKYFINTKLVDRSNEPRRHYIEVEGVSGKSSLVNLMNYFIGKFGGIKKLDRQIPNEVFVWNKEAQLSFMAGMIDADGYLNNTKVLRIQLGSTNKELALQQAMLARQLGMEPLVYLNHYSRLNPEAVRYRVEFIPTEELINYIACEKKRKHFTGWTRKNNSILTTDMCSVTKAEKITEQSYSYDVTTSSEHFEISGIYSHNCRSFLTPYIDEKTGNPKYYGRFNAGVTSINLADLALSSGGDFNKFWELFEERTELCHLGLKARLKRLEQVTSDVAPILWQNGALARLNKEEGLYDLLHHGYCTVSLGYGALYECVKYMTGHSHTDGAEGEKFGLEVMQRLNDKCAQWKAAEDIDYSVYGTPLESGTYKFAKSLKKRFGEDVFIKLDGKDRDYVTNSYHVPVFEHIDPFTKLTIESKFQKLSPGGAISYIETADLTGNIDAVLTVMHFIYDNIMYAELNTKSDYCHECGYDGEMKINSEDMTWYCPNCGNTNQDTMNIARRTCGRPRLF